MENWKHSLINSGLIFGITELSAALTYVMLPDARIFVMGLIAGGISFLVQCKELNAKETVIEKDPVKPKKKKSIPLMIIAGWI